MGAQGKFKLRDLEDTALLKGPVMRCVSPFVTGKSLQTEKLLKIIIWFCRKITRRIRLSDKEEQIAESVEDLRILKSPL